MVNQTFRRKLLASMRHSLLTVLCCAFFLVAEARDTFRVLEARKKHDTTAEIALKIDQYLSASGISGGVLIARNGKILLNKGYGWANEADKIAISGRTVFDIGSVTKQFTAAAILKLEEQGKLRSSDTITKYFDHVPADKQGITIHQLLTHTAGFEHDAIEATAFPSRTEAIEIMLSSKLKLQPGEKFSYSNAGYGLLAAIIELASGMGYEQFLYHHLWKPAGMVETGNLLPNWQQKQLVRPFDLSGEVDRPINQLWAKDGPSWSTRGSGAVLSTLEDLYKWHTTLQGELVLSQEAKQKLVTPYVPFVDANRQYYYGYGWSVSKTERGTTLVQHNGGNSYTFTDFYRYVDEDVVILYFTNERQTISLKILDAVPSLFFGKPFPNFPQPQLDPGDLDLSKYAGTYQLPSGQLFKLYLNNGMLAVDVMNREIGKLLTTFPTQNKYRHYPQLQTSIAIVSESVAEGNLDGVRDLIYVEGTIEEEKEYWKRTFAEWTGRFGPFKGSELIGSSPEKDLLITYVMFHFEKGATLVQFRKHGEKHFYIGTSTRLLPKQYRFIPKSNSKFLVYNPILETTTLVHFSFIKGIDTVGGVTIQHADGSIFARKLE